jgi:hypothetical protein
MIRTHRLASAMFTLALSAAVASPVYAQTAGQSMKNAGTDTKDAAKDTGHAVAHGTKTATHKTVHGTRTATHKTVHGTKKVAHKTRSLARRPPTAPRSPRRTLATQRRLSATRRQMAQRTSSTSWTASLTSRSHRHVEELRWLPTGTKPAGGNHNRRQPAGASQRAAGSDQQGGALLQGVVLSAAKDLHFVCSVHGPNSWQATKMATKHVRSCEGGHCYSGHVLNESSKGDAQPAVIGTLAGAPDSID